MTSPLKHAAVLERAEAHHGKFAAFAGAKPIHTEIVEACVAGAAALRAQAEVSGDVVRWKDGTPLKVGDVIPMEVAITLGQGYSSAMIDPSEPWKWRVTAAPIAAPDEALRDVETLYESVAMYDKAIDDAAARLRRFLSASHPEPRTPEAEALREAFLHGFEVARDKAEISEWDGWYRTNPVIDWARAEKQRDTEVKDYDAPLPALTPDAQLMAAKARCWDAEQDEQVAHAKWMREDKGKSHEEDAWCRDVAPMIDERNAACRALTALEAQVKP